MSKLIIGGIIFGAAGIVLATAGITVNSWQFYAAMALMVCAELLGANL
jgi:hypothetical protein